MTVRRRSSARRYGFSVGFVARWLLTLSLGRTRNLGRDAVDELGRVDPRPRVEGADRIPRADPFVVVMNHYERLGLRVWWPAMVVSEAIWKARGQDPPIRWLITDRFHRYRLGPLRLPDWLLAWLLRRIAGTYGLVLVPRPQAARRSRAQALLRARRELREPGASPIGLTPDVEGRARPARAWRNAGAAVAALSAGGVPVLPVAVFEDDGGCLVARFGAAEPFAAPADREQREAQAQALMSRIESLLPEQVAIDRERDASG